MGTHLSLRMAFLSTGEVTLARGSHLGNTQCPVCGYTNKLIKVKFLKAPRGP